MTKQRSRRSGPLLRSIAAAVVVAAIVGALLNQRLGAEIEHEAQKLEAIAAEAAARIDGAAHARIQVPEDARTPAFDRIRRLLREVAERHELESPVYTLRRVEGGTRFVVMTNPDPYIGDAYQLRAEMRPVFEQGGRARTGVYQSDSGHWISGYAPIKGVDGVEALVSVDRSSRDLVLARNRALLLTGLAALLAGILAAWLPAVLRRDDGVVGGLKRVFTGSLAVRIGLAGSAAVLVAIGVAGTLEHRYARRATVDGLKTRLLTAVRVGVNTLDAAQHVEVARSKDPKSAAFLELRDALRRIKEAAELTSPVYTLRRVGDGTRFVVMTNETPFVDDPHELRPGVRATFQGEGAGSEGPYSDAHGTWISAWAPLEHQGEIIAVLQADYEVGTLLAALANQSLRQALFGLLGVGVAFFLAFYLARGIAAPIREVAAAARRVETGDFTVRVAEDRLDEVGELAHAINQMATGLGEREKLRNMFGRYMAGQVVSELMARGEVTLEGELRPLTVVISDIRGYTALTERLGAREVVELLNEYFAILVDAVIKRDGVVDKFMGDAMLCWFGAPVAQPDHPQRAVDACVEILRRLEGWNQEREARGLAPVGTGIGIATGEVVVGNIGSAQRVEYTAIGDAVNLASRLCSQAESGEIVVDDAVRAATEAPYHAMGEITVKGVKEPLKVHKIEVADLG